MIIICIRLRFGRARTYTKLHRRCNSGISGNLLKLAAFGRKVAASGATGKFASSGDRIEFDSFCKLSPGRTGNKLFSSLHFLLFILISNIRLLIYFFPKLIHSNFQFYSFINIELLSEKFKDVNWINLKLYNCQICKDFFPLAVGK